MLSVAPGCGDDDASSDSDAGASVTASSETGTTGGESTEGGLSTSDATSAGTTEGATTNETSTGEATTGEATTATTDAATTDATTGEATTGEATTGGLDELAVGVVNATCGPDDWPLLAFNLGLETEACGQGGIGRLQIRLGAYNWDPLAPGEYALIPEYDWVVYEPEEDVWYETNVGVVIIESWDGDGVTGSYALEFEGLPPVVGGFTQIPYCMDEPGCL
ncbi:MAG: hypothetical protein H6713_26865 [Myxococcales bacterium]|nr:hypothetical protein [Myxococcales bacterium]